MREELFESRIYRKCDLPHARLVTLSAKVCFIPAEPLCGVAAKPAFKCDPLVAVFRTVRHIVRRLTASAKQLGRVKLAIICGLTCIVASEIGLLALEAFVEQVFMQGKLHCTTTKRRKDFRVPFPFFIPTTTYSSFAS